MMNEFPCATIVDCHVNKCFSALTGDERKVSEVGMREVITAYWNEGNNSFIEHREEIVRCKDCKHRPADPENKGAGPSLVFPDEICPCRIDDDWYSWMPDDNWFCAEGERRDEND